jgi:hypothetical protein
MSNIQIFVPDKENSFPVFLSSNNKTALNPEESNTVSWPQLDFASTVTLKPKNPVLSQLQAAGLSSMPAILITYPRSCPTWLFSWTFRVALAKWQTLERSSHHHDSISFNQGTQYHKFQAILGPKEPRGTRIQLFLSMITQRPEVVPVCQSRWEEDLVTAV